MEVQIAYSTLKLIFAEAGPAATLQLGPFPEIRISGEALRAERGGEVLARHQKHAWLVQQRSFFRLDCPSPVRLHFENAYGESSPVYGPFVQFSMADGMAFGDGVIYANLDLETRRWYDHRGQRYWPELVVKSASAP
jgi:hypothetical protein